MTALPGTHLTEVGGKAAVLQKLAAAGFPVPEFEVSPDGMQACVDRLGLPLAVRSSASGEDGAEFSFAGQFQSFLNLMTIDEVDSAVEACERSLQDPHVAEYCRRAGIDIETVQMHVIVQRMVDAELAGVAFSVDPLSGQANVVIEACSGLGDELLAGKTNALADTDPLLQRYRPAIETLAKDVQHYFGQPQDIEFAVHAGKVFLLQARPVTRIQFAATAGEWTNADFRDGGVSSSVCSPLMWSLYEKVWNDSLKSSLHAIHLRGPDFVAGKMFFGRPYWNLGVVKQRVARIPGFVEREFDEDIGVEIAYEGDGFRQKWSVATILKMIPVVWGVSRYLARQWNAAEQRVAQGLVPIDVAGRHALLDPEHRMEVLIRDHYLPLETTYFKTIFALSLAKLDFHMSYPDADFGSLVTGLPPLSHSAPERWFAESQQESELIQNNGEWKERFGHHCRFGIDVIHPRWDEDLEFVERLRTASRADGNSDGCSAEEGQSHRQGQRQGQPQGQNEHQLGGDMSRRGRRKLSRLRRLIWLREELRNQSNRMYYYLRKCAVRLGEERFLGGDVFFMTYQELLDDDRSQLEEAKWTFEAFRNFAAPHEIGHRFVGGQVEESELGHWQGIAAGRGVATGPAAVARTVEEAMAAPRGAILICPFTEPGWTPVLGRVAGVVTETGGLLSHAAVICREYDLPAILGVTEATKRIPHGAHVEVDGMNGTIRLLESPYVEENE